jgi:polyisoprenoid-binding protein YceI
LTGPADPGPVKQKVIPRDSTNWPGILSSEGAAHPGSPICPKYLLQRICQRGIQRTEKENWPMSTTSTATTATANSATTTWNIDPAHSAAEFKIKHMMISNVKGKFTGLSGKLLLNSADISKSSVEASIPVTTLNTGDEQRDGHLKSADFFEAEKFPNMTFVSTKVQPTGEGEGKVTGDLTLHGVTKQVTFEVEGPSQPGKDPWGNTRIGLSATAKINRKDFGLAWNTALETGGVLVGEDVTISLDVQFIKA